MSKEWCVISNHSKNIFTHNAASPSETNLIIWDIKFNLYHKIFFGSGGIRTHASEETGA